MVDPAGSSFVLRYAGVTSTAAQTGAESARVRSAADVSTEHANRHRALILRRVPPAAGTAFGPRAMTALVADSTVRRSTPGARSPEAASTATRRALGSQRPCSW